jgi:hypothetical protein
VTNRILFEAGDTTLIESGNGGIGTGPDPRSLPTDAPVLELSTNFLSGAPFPSLISISGTSKKNPAILDQSNQRFSVTYITGSHAAKFGVTMQEGWITAGADMNYIPGVGPAEYQFLRGVPVAIVEAASPNIIRYRLMPNLGLYAQDQWTLRRFTFNYGVRFDYNREKVLAQQLPAIDAFGIPARSFPAVNDVPNWKDISPRIGVAYDLFGNGKTAIKGAIGRYVLAEGTNLGGQNAPASLVAGTVTRTWTPTAADIQTLHASGNLTPTCNLANPAANGECGAISNQLFGQPVYTTTFDPGFLNGWYKRPYMWQDNIQVQQELRPGVALNVAFFNVWYGNFTTTINTAATPGDYSPYCVTAPTDARLGSYSGQQICGLYDVNPAKFGKVQNLVELSSNLGKEYQHFDGVDVSMSSRFGTGGLVQGGVSLGQTVFDDCAIVQSYPNAVSLVNPYPGTPAASSGTSFTAPRNGNFCHTVNPWAKQTQYKMAFNLPLPFDLAMSGTYQNLPGLNDNATLSYTSAQIAPSLGRQLSAGANATANFLIVPPYQLYESRIQQLDLRWAKKLHVGRTRIEGDFDIYNVFNANPVLSTNAAYGATFLKPALILSARLFKIGAIVTF